MVLENTSTRGSGIGLENHTHADKATAHRASTAVLRVGRTLDWVSRVAFDQSRFQPPHPDVAERVLAFRIAVILDRQRQFGRMRCVVRCRAVGRGGRPHQHGVRLHQRAVQDGGDPARAFELAVLEAGGAEDDVVTIPGAGRTHRVHQRGRGAIDRAGGAVRIGFVVIGIHDLQFVEAHQKHAGIAAMLRIERRLGRVRRHPLDVDLRVAEFLLAVDEIVGLAAGSEDSVMHAPISDVIAGPLRQVLAVEQHGCV